MACTGTVTTFNRRLSSFGSFVLKIREKLKIINFYLADVAPPQ
jgi:hypothetical protein